MRLLFERHKPARNSSKLKRYGNIRRNLAPTSISRNGPPTMRGGLRGISEQGRHQRRVAKASHPNGTKSRGSALGNVTSPANTNAKEGDTRAGCNRDAHVNERNVHTPEHALMEGTDKLHKKFWRGLKRKAYRRIIQPRVSATYEDRHVFHGASLVTYHELARSLFIGSPSKMERKKATIDKST